MYVRDPLTRHVDDMFAMINETLAKIDEESVKLRVVRQADVETVLIEEYNNGYISLSRLQKLKKVTKDRCSALLRQHTFKMENIQKAEKLRIILDSVQIHRQEGRVRAIYD